MEMLVKGKLRALTLVAIIYEEQSSIYTNIFQFVCILFSKHYYSKPKNGLVYLFIDYNISGTI